MYVRNVGEDNYAFIKGADNRFSTVPGTWV
jgi:hypothetical protein